MNKSILLVLLSAFILGSSSAQTVPIDMDMVAPGVDAYDNRISTPQDVIGHVIGSRHTVPHQVVEYFKAIDAESDRVVVREHGKTYENRRLIHAIVTSPANHARLEEIRQNHLQLSDEPNAVSDADLESMPIIVYAGYSVHGNEASGTEAAVLTLYHLAAGQGAAMDELLANAVIIVDPMFNPDGRDRFTDWANRFRGTTHAVDNQDIEHNEAWPGGRTNHYLFDLNRDWLPAVHQESHARLALFHAWRPQILTDHHEMGGNATFFFQPGIQSRTNPNTPPRNQELTKAIATFHSRALDARGSLYYAEESFDDFYYGKGSTYPDVNGAIGILFEQASSRALETTTQNGPLHYAFTVSNQFSTSLSTLEAAIEMRTELLKYHRDFYAGAADFARQSRTKAYVVNGRDPSRVKFLVDLLDRHRIDSYELEDGFSAVSVAGQNTAFGNNSVVIPVDQTQSRLIVSLFETRSQFQDSLFYDVSTWTLPLAYGLDHVEMTSVPALGDRITGTRSGAFGGQSSYAYAIPWDGFYSARTLYKLQEAGVRVRSARKSFDAISNGSVRSFDRGTLIIWVNQSGVDAAALREILVSAAEVDFANVYPIDTGNTPVGPDLGTGTAPVIEKPVIGILAGSGTSSYNVGEAWHLLSHRMQIPVSLLDQNEIGSKDLSKYTVLVHTGGRFQNQESIKGWVEKGGTLITLSSATNQLVTAEWMELEEKELDVDSLLQDVPYDKLGPTRGAQRIGGSILRASVDTTHPLAFGIPEVLPVFRNSTTFYKPDKSAGSTVARYAADAWISGYVSDERAPLAAGSVVLGTKRMAQGRLIYFADNPNFRGFWLGTSRMFLNAVMLGSSL